MMFSSPFPPAEVELVGDPNRTEIVRRALSRATHSGSVPKGDDVSTTARRTTRVIERPGYVLTNHRAMCRRGVLWIGQTCNLRCHFCYFLDKIANSHHPEHAFLPLEKIKAMCKILVDVYANNSVDIQGGEPTIYRHILPLLQYRNEIGLKPTLISNGYALANREKCQQLKDAGVYDLLLSVHGLGEHYDRIVRVPGAADRLQRAIGHLADLDIPFRFNTVLCQEALPDLMGVARLAVDRGARALNFIAFNPFVDQSLENKRSIENVPRYREVVDHLLPVIDYLDAHQVEVNVRYLPFCLFPERYRKFVQNFQQIIYDLHEWESAGEAWSGAVQQRQAAGPLSEPLDFFRHIEAIRMGAFGQALEQLPAAQRWSPSVRATLDALDDRLARARRPITASLYGSALVGTSIRHAAAERPTLAAGVRFVAFVSSACFRTADQIDGLRWQTSEWLAENPTDVVVNTSQSSRAAISSALEAIGLSDRSIEVFGVPSRAACQKPSTPVLDFPGRAGYEYLPYLPELGPLPGAGTLELAYKEFRVLMPKTMHPYAKEESCRSCSLLGICDGFHRDYAEFFGFEEAASQVLAHPVHDPRHYSCEQMKVVEQQEFDWAMPAEYDGATLRTREAAIA